MKITTVVAQRIVLIGFLVASSSVFARNIYVSQSGAGSANGADAAVPHPLSWLNASGNWGSGANQINPGDVVNLVGTFTSPLTIAGSGTASQPVTILFASGANFTTGCWPSAPSGAIALNYKSNIIINGANTGIIQNTSNGTGLTTQNDSSGIAGEGYNITIENLTITNIYVQKPGDPARVGYAVEPAGYGLTVSNCSLSWGDGCLSYEGPQPTSAYTIESNIFIVNNFFYNFNHGFQIANGGGQASGQHVLLTNIVISGNYFAPGGCFFDSQNLHHQDEVIIFVSSQDPTVVLSGLRCFQNTFSDRFNNGSSAFFNNINDNTAQFQNMFVYNNVFYASSNSWADGFVSGCGSNFWVVNNTMMGGGTQGGSVEVGGTNAYCYNNIMYTGAGVTLQDITGLTVTNANTCINVGWVLSNTMQSVWSDYNAYSSYSTGGFGFKIYSSTGGLQFQIPAGFSSLSAWQSYYNNNCGLPQPIWNATHCDPHSTTNYPEFVGGTFIPASSDTVARAAGTNLSFLGITTDFNGSPRPATGNWDIGAFVVGSTPQNQSTNPPVPITAPLGVHFAQAGGFTNVVNGLAGYWTFNDGPGATTAVDASGNGNNATLGNSPAWVPGASNGYYALSFTGNANVSIPSPGLQPATLTVSCWVNNAPNGGNQLMASVDHNSLYYAWSLAYGYFNFGTDFSFGVGSVFAHASSTPYAGQWTFVTGVYDGSNVYLYLNGNNVATTPCTTNPDYSGNSAVLIGAGDTNGGGELGGSVEDVRIYSRALSAGEVADLFGYGAQP